MALGARQTRALLQAVPQAYHTQINDVLLTGLLQAFAGWAGVRALWIDLEGHGREALFEELDLTRTVGWFTAIYPVRLALAGAELGEALKAVKEQLRAVPQRGVGYGVLRYLHAEGAVLAGLPAPQVSFNYLGQFDQVLSGDSPFTAAPEGRGALRSPLGRRRHLLDVTANVTGGRLRVLITYSAARHRRESIERLAHHYLQALEQLIAHCLSPEAGGYTPSDFALARIDQDELEQAVEEVEFEG